MVGRDGRQDKVGLGEQGFILLDQGLIILTNRNDECFQQRQFAGDDGYVGFFDLKPKGLQQRTEVGVLFYCVNDRSSVEVNKR